MMQGGAQAAQEHGAEAAEGGPDLQGMLTHHLLDGSELEVVTPWFAWHYELPHFDPIHIGSMTIDLSITKHVFFLLLAAVLLLLLFLFPLRPPCHPSSPPPQRAYQQLKAFSMSVKRSHDQRSSPTVTGLINSGFGG